MESWVNIGQHYGTISILLLLIKQQSVVDSQSMRQSICNKFVPFVIWTQESGR